MIVKSAVVVVLGPPVLAVLAFEAASHVVTVFNHANVRLSPRADRFLRWLIVSPDMHRIHHSASAPETDSNFGFILPWWDRLFGTYRDQPWAGHERMVVGLESFRAGRELWLDRLLLNPFVDIRPPNALKKLSGSGARFAPPLHPPEASPRKKNARQVIDVAGELNREASRLGDVGSEDPAPRPRPRRRPPGREARRRYDAATQHHTLQK